MLSDTTGCLNSRLDSASMSFRGLHPPSSGYFRRIHRTLSQWVSLQALIQGFTRSEHPRAQYMLRIY